MAKKLIPRESLQQNQEDNRQVANGDSNTTKESQDQKQNQDQNKDQEQLFQLPEWIKKLRDRINSNGKLHMIPMQAYKGQRRFGGKL